MENITKLIMIRFGELNTKGKNKRDFISTLYLNIKNALRKYEVEISTRFDHIYIEFKDENYDEIINILKNISGIYSFSLVYKINDTSIDSLVDFCFKQIQNEVGSTFKIICKRSDKNYPMHSDKIIRTVASKILKNTSLKVDVHNPDIKLNISILFDGIYVYFNAILGIGGYPLGTNGKSLMMISGGIDSPVAAFLMLKRGIALDFIHFASPPYTSEEVITKVSELLKVLNTYQRRINLYIFPFTKLQEEIYKNIDESYCITIMRRMMYRIADRMCDKYKLKCITNGESIGQVASQTLDSMNVITKNIDHTIIRPLACYDKLEIIDIAKRIGTYDISIKPFEDCCTIFKPKNPKTSPHLDKILEYEAKFDYQTLIDEGMKDIQKIVIKEEEFQI